MHKGKTRRRREEETEKISKKIMTENFPKLMSDSKPQFQETQRTISRINAKNTYTKVYYFQTTENQKQREKEGSQRKH